MSIKEYGRLNRTSVGLKPGHADRNGAQMLAPQSNQRGIETWVAGLGLSCCLCASIEPAWD